MTDKCQAPGLECEQCRLKCQLPLIEAEKAQLEKSDADKERYTIELYNRAKEAESKNEDLESELARLQVALEATIAEKERCRKLAVEHSVNAAGLEQKLSMCENMKLAREFEELLQTTSIPVAVERLKELLAVQDAAERAVCKANGMFQAPAFMTDLKQVLANTKEVSK